MAEPMLAMIRLLGSIATENKVQVPGFYDNVAQVTDAERDYYTAVASITGMDTENVMRKWRQPTFSVSSIQSNSSGPTNNTIIPKSVTAHVSFRLVPNQVSRLFDVAQGLLIWSLSVHRGNLFGHREPLS